jgi:parallel beta-helix repeat protein
MRKLMHVGVAALLVSLMLCIPALADELHVGTKDGYSSLTAAVEAAAPGDVIRLAPKVYDEPNETYPIEINKPVSLIGEPGTVLKGPPFKALLKVTASDVSVEDVEIQLLRWGIVDTGDRLSLANCRFVLADDAYRVSSCGVWMAGVFDCSITNCDFNGCGVCMAGPSLSERSKELPVLTGLFEVGEDTAFFTSHTLTDNLINGKPLYYFVNETNLSVPRDAGGVIAACCENITVEGVDVSGSSMGLELVHCQNVQVSGVTADRCGIFGVYLAHVNGGIVKNVTCLEANHGIDLRAVQSMIVTGCDTTDCEQGIFLSHAYDCIVDNCSISRCGNGFFIAGGEGNQLSDSFVEGNDNGVYIQGEKDMLVCGNEITLNKVAGVRFLRSGGQVTGNNIHDNQTGVLASEDDPLTLWRNSLSGNASAGLYMKDITSGKISFNSFDSTEKVFMELDGSIADTLIWQNTFHGGMNRIIDHTGIKVPLALNNWSE